MRIFHRIVLTVSVILTLFIAAVLPVSAASIPTDVSPDHWAYKAVVSLVDKGYLTYFQDGAFRGDLPVDRFNMAVIVSKILNEVALGTKPASKEDMNLLRKLSLEFRDEMVALSTKVNLFDERLKYLENGFKLSQDDQAQSENQLQTLQDEAKQIVADILAIKKRMETLEDKNKLMDRDLNDLRNRVRDLEGEIKGLRTWNTVLSVIAVLGLLI